MMTTELHYQQYVAKQCNANTMKCASSLHQVSATHRESILAIHSIDPLAFKQPKQQRKKANESIKSTGHRRIAIAFNWFVFP